MLSLWPESAFLGLFFRTENGYGSALAFRLTNALFETAPATWAVSLPICSRVRSAYNHGMVLA